MNWLLGTILLANLQLAASWKVQVSNAPDNVVHWGVAETHVLRCTVSGLKEAGDLVEFNWQYEKLPSYKVYTIPGQGNRALTFTKNITVSDSGEFTCVARAYGEEKTYPVKVTFVGKFITAKLQKYFVTILLL